MPDLHGLVDPVGVDFETYYTKDYSLKNLTVYEYTRDPRFDAYLVSVHAPDLHWVGHPSEFNWDLLNGRDLLAHNAAFDGLVLQELQTRGIIKPGFKPRGLTCTADMTAYLRTLRNLENAAKYLLNRDISKGVRNEAKGKTSEQMRSDPAFWERMVQYSGGDSVASYDLWDAHGHRWPADEQLVSRMNRERGWQGVYVDTPKLLAAITNLQGQLNEHERNIPWDWDTRKTPLAPTQIRLECRKVGIPCPGSFAKDDEDCAAWEDQYAEQFPWVRALRAWRRVNMLLEKLLRMHNGSRNDIFSFALKYWGAATGRFSGNERFNMQNLPKDPMFGVNLRELIVADPGYVFLSTDLAQIEARILLWMAGDTAQLDLIRQGLHVYEAHARQSMNWTGGPLKEENKKLYNLAKARVLGLGFGCGDKKFVKVAWTMASVVITPEESVAIVADYRRNNRKIVGMWQRLHQGLVFSTIEHDKTHEITLPNGRALVYFNPRFRASAKEGERKGQIEASFMQGDRAKSVYGGLLTENAVQGTARDLMVNRWLALEKAGIHCRFTVHDEFVQVVRRQDVEEVQHESERIVTTVPEWLEGCPLGVESKVSPHYVK